MGLYEVKPKKVTKRFPRRRGRKKPTTKQMAKHALTLAKQSIIVPELKVFQSVLNTFNADWLGTSLMNFTNLIAIGTGDNQRIGNEIRVKQVSVNWNSDQPTTGLLRVIMIVDKDNLINQGSQLMATSATGTAPLSMYQRFLYRPFTKPSDEANKFTVLYDKIFNASADTGFSQLQTITHTFPGPGLKVTWNLTPGVATQTNAIKIFFIGYAASPAGSSSIAGYTETVYTDA